MKGIYLHFYFENKELIDNPVCHNNIYIDNSNCLTKMTAEVENECSFK